MVSVAEGSEVRSLRFVVEPTGREVVSDPELAVVAGFTGRDRVAVWTTSPSWPSTASSSPEVVPCFYALPPHLVTQDGVLVTTERGTSGRPRSASSSTTARSS